MSILCPRDPDSFPPEARRDVGGMRWAGKSAGPLEDEGKRRLISPLCVWGAAAPLSTVPFPHAYTPAPILQSDLTASSPKAPLYLDSLDPLRVTFPGEPAPSDQNAVELTGEKAPSAEALYSQQSLTFLPPEAGKTRALTAMFLPG